MAKGYKNNTEKTPDTLRASTKIPALADRSIGPTDTKAEQPSTMLQPVTLAKPSGSGNPLLVTTALANSITSKEFPG